MAYIDPATGSILFTVLISTLGSGYYLFQNLKVKTKFVISGGARAKDATENAAPIVIFSDSKRYWNLFEPICEELERRKIHARYLTMSDDDPALQRQFHHIECSFIGSDNRAFGKLNFLNAEIVLSTTPGLDVYQWKRSRNVKYYVHILHMVSDPATYRMFGLDFYDAVLLSSPYQISQIRKLEQIRGIPEKELVVAGMPYLDEQAKRLSAALSKAPSESAVLLAPSWGNSGILKKYGSKIIRALVDTGRHIIIRPHPQSFISEADLMDRLMKEFPENEQLEWNRDNDNFDVLRRADILISDFSGIICDFCFVFRKPVIYADTDFDDSAYDACWLDEKLWIFQVLEKIGVRLKESEIDKIGSLIDQMLSDSSFGKALDEVIESAWSEIGHSSEKTADYLEQKLKEIRSAETGL